MEQSDPTVAEHVRAAHRHYPTGVTVVTTGGADHPTGLTVSSFASVSLEPPTVLFCINSRALSYVRLYEASVVGISFLSSAQRHVAEVFATKDEDKFAQVAWSEGAHGVPLITGAVAQLQARVDDRHDVGTHTIFICQVLQADVSEGRPLLYLNRTYFDPEDLTPCP